MKIYGYQNEEENTKKNRTLFHTNFQAFIDKILQIGRTYDLTVVYRTDDGLKTFISSKTLDIPMIHLDAEDNRTIHCDAEHVEKSRKIAARWVSAIYTEEKQISRAVNITFYAAPKWFCFDSYEIRLLKDNTLFKSVNVTSDQLYRNGSNWMGNVTFFDLLRNSSYFVIIHPNERRMKDKEICLCRISSSCECVLSKSKSFEIDDFHNKIGRRLVESVSQKYIPEVSGEKTKEKETKPLIIIFLIFSIIAAILIIVFLVLCVYRILKRSTKWQKTLLIKSSGSGESLTPLIKTQPVQKIFILNPNVEKSEFVTEIAQFLQSKGLTIFYFAFDIKQLEENAFYYVHKAIADSDKVILVHGNKTQKFIEDGKIIYDRISSNYFDNAFIIALSLLKLNDSKILHANFIDDNLNSSKFLITETLYTLPRDLSYLFQGLRLQIDQTAIKHLNDSFNIQKDSETNELESIIVCRNNSTEIIKNEEAESVINSIGIIENNNEKTDTPDQSNTDSGFHSI
uniref:SEFIR domain-containing protein n=1 Tax=Panagrolaimus sp. PS1159 TaxID=55785 RepID=A0AC35F1B6_9BILA